MFHSPRFSTLRKGTTDRVTKLYRNIFTGQKIALWREPVISGDEQRALYSHALWEENVLLGSPLLGRAFWKARPRFWNWEWVTCSGLGIWGEGTPSMDPPSLNPPWGFGACFLQAEEA